MLLLYTLLFVIIVFIELLFIKKKIEWHTQLYWLIGVALICFSTFRDGNSFPDYVNYVSYYDSIVREETVFVEYSFVLISYFSNFIFHNVIGIFFIYACLGVTLKLYALRQLSNLCFLAILIYVANTYLVQELIQIRAGVAAAFLLLCIKPIYDRDLKKFLLFFLLGFFFHSSAIFILPLWFINPKALNNKLWFWVIPFGYAVAILKVNILPFLDIPLIQEKINIYLSVSEQETINIFNVLFLLKCLIAYVFLYYSSVIRHYNKYFFILLKVYILSLFCFLFFSTTPTIAFRSQGLYEVVDFILIPYMIYMFRPWSIGKIIPILIGVSYIFLIAIHAQLIFN